MKSRGIPLAALLVISVITAGPHAMGQTGDASRQWVYTLLPGSELTDNCPDCGPRPPVIVPMRGSFRLRWLEENLLFTRYELLDISFVAGAAPGPEYRVTGRGIYQVGGEVAFLQELTLTVSIGDGKTNRLCRFTSGPRPVDRLWPILQIAVDQTSGTGARVYQLNLLAAPLREIWFSTVNGFTPSLGLPPVQRVSAGDLLSSTGGVVRSNFELTRNLGIMPGVPDLGLDAVHVLPNGEIVFSLEQDAFSETLGPLQHGDLLAARGRMVRRNQDLYAAFSPFPSPDPPDVGLDAVQMLDNGEIYFSMETDLFSERLGVMLKRGDLLSSGGRIIKDNRQLLARFHPPPGSAPRDYGLDAVHAWPSGEIWFSLEEGFQDQNLGPILAGDLLSDQGHVIWRNLDLLAPFAPLEDLADFGLDALYLVSGEIPPPPPSGPVWAYSLLDGSRLIDECLVCGRPPLIVPLRGSFDLRLVEENPLFATYALENLSFHAGAPPGPVYLVNGHGTYRFGGEVALVQDLFLEAYIDDGRSYQLCFFTNETQFVQRPWPMIQIRLNQTNGTVLQTFTLDLEGAPWREIWFSTAHGFHPGTAPPPATYVNPGDLISQSGRVVTPNSDLTRRLGIMPPVPDLGLDAVDILPGGEIVFSLEQDTFSQSLGPLHHGDLLSARGRLVQRNQELIRAFVIMPPVPDLGLDAVQVQTNGEVYFSIETDIFSGTGGLLQRGDLLSNQGRAVKRNQQLLARFHPADTKKDYGLDAVYVWPSDEVWFSTEDPFDDERLGAIRPGDLLSDQGYVVYRNLELLGAFQPLEELADFGLDALYVVSDTTVAPGGAYCRSIRVEPGTGSLILVWDARGQVFQLERARDAAGPYLPRGPITPELIFTEAGATTNQAPAFYRLRLW